MSAFVANRAMPKLFILLLKTLCIFNNFVKLHFQYFILENKAAELFPELSNTLSSNNETEFLNDIIPQAFSFYSSYNGTTNSSDNCGRLNIMGTIVEESGPYLYPFIIEFSLIGAAVIYVMWKHIGRNPK